MAEITLDRTSGVPFSRQIEDKIVQLIRVGILRHGEKLPAVRSLASSLGVNRNTVQRVYQHLVRAGVFEARIGDGTYVSLVVEQEGMKPRQQAQTRIRRALEAILDLGFTQDEINDMMQVELANMTQRRNDSSVDRVRSRNRFAEWRRYQNS